MQQSQKEIMLFTARTVLNFCFMCRGYVLLVQVYPFERQPYIQIR